MMSAAASKERISRAPLFLFSAGDSAAADYHIAVIENDCLPAGDGTLGFVEFHVEHAVRCHPCGGRLCRVAVADLRLDTNRLFQAVAGDEVDIRCGKLSGKQVLKYALPVLIVIVFVQGFIG